MAQRKDLFITAVQLIPVDGEKTVPTTVYYKDGKPLVGMEAIDQPDPTTFLKDNFKIELGKKDPTSLATKSYGASKSPTRSPIGIAKDFCDQTLAKIRNHIEASGYPYPKRILIAEPLSLGSAESASDAWLSNYRASMRRTLHGKFEEVDFMPEPFAVFQYYRYGIRHPLIAQKQKHIALVMDFGGGTFDVSVIETTSEGDISQGGRGSRPLSASSIPVGGFYINQMIADDLLFSAIDKKADKAAIRKTINKFNEVKNYDESDISDLRDDHLAFFHSYRDLLRNVEDAKVSICSSIANWSLTADLSNSAAYRVRVPQNPFSQTPNIVEIRLDAEKIREIFETRIWKQKLLPAIKSGLTRAAQELGGKPISVTLLSGGSSNIRWLKHFIERDLGEIFQNAEVLELSEDFQEIVAKGLAVECARRYYTEGEGDFRAVTYNRLCLALSPNGQGAEIKKLRPASEALSETTAENGVLIPSSSSLRGLIDKPLRWRTKLSTTPSRYMDYYFLRSSFDPEDTDNLHNIVDNSIGTPSGTKFSSGIEVELVIREDGTATPSFIYGKTGNQGHETVVEGRPFYMDMTFATEEVAGDTYLGFDFGTSTSAFSFVKNDDVREYTQRSKDKNWQEISDLVHSLPYPIAYPLASFIAETSADGIEKWGRETLECMLTIAAYICYAEATSLNSDRSTHLLKGFEHRSAGPLWDLLKKSSALLPSKPNFSLFCRDFLDSDLRAELDHAVSEIAQAKHGKLARELDYQRIIGQVGNALSKVFSEFPMGYFEDVRQQQFSFSTYEGVFRCIQGPSAPFVKLYEYQGPEGIPPGFVFIASPEKGIALNLSPLIISGLKHFSGVKGPELHFFDTYRRKTDIYGFKAIQEDEEFSVESTGKFGSIHSHLSAMKEKDIPGSSLSGIQLTERK